MMNQTKKHTTGKKLLALLLALIMTVSLLPMSVFAAEPGAEETPVVEGQTQPAAETGEDDAEQAQEPDADEVDEGEEDAVLPGDAEDDADDADAADDGVATFAATDSNATLDYRIVHLDCGRKYFSVANIKTLIDNMYLAGYNQLELAIGNAGLRFLLDDMSISFTVNGNTITYDNDTMVEKIKAGNKAQNNSNDDSCLTETDMKLIIAYANARGIEVVPLLNMPGHMNAVLNGFPNYRISGSNGKETVKSSSTLNLNSDEAKAFGLALLQKYVDFFKGRVSYFNFGADEVANDIVNPFYGYNSGYETQCVPYMNKCAEIIDTADMRPRAFNDYMYFGKNNSGTSVALNTAIEVCFWNTQWQSACPYVYPGVIAQKGHKLINTNSEWYYVLGNKNNNLNYALDYVESLDYNAYHVSDHKTVTADTAGVMICLWCDQPNAGTQETVITEGTTLLKAFAEKEANSTLGFTKATITTEAPVIMGAQKTVALSTGTMSVSVQDAASTVEWASSDPDVITVEETATGATLKLLKAGTATITATSINGSDSVTIKVTDSSSGGTEPVDPNPGETTTTVDVTLKVGETKSIPYKTADYPVWGKYEIDTTAAGYDNTIANVTVSYETKDKTPVKAESITSGESYYIMDDTGKVFLTAENGRVTATTDVNKATKWKITALTNGFGITGYEIQAQVTDAYANYYLTGTSAQSLSLTSNFVDATVSQSSNWFCSKGLYYQLRSATTGVAYGALRYVLYDSTSSEWSVGWHSSNVVFYETTADQTNISFEGIKTGTTAVKVGDVTYNITVKPVVNVELKVGQTSEGYEGAADATITKPGDASIATAKLEPFRQDGGTTRTLGSLITPTSTRNDITSYEGVITNNGHYMVLSMVNGKATISDTTDINEATLFTIKRNGNSASGAHSNHYGYAISTVVSGTTYYVARSSNVLIAQANAFTWYPGGDPDFSVAETTGSGRNQKTTYYILAYDNGWTIDSNGGWNKAGKAYRVKETTVEGKDVTNITFTGVKPGNTTYVIDDVTYVVTVKAKEVPVTLEVGDRVTFDVGNDRISESPNTDIAKAELDGKGTLTLTGVAVGGPTYCTVGDTRYVITVVEKSSAAGTLLYVDLWVTNHGVLPDGDGLEFANNSGTGTGNRRVTVQYEASKFASPDGELLSDVLPKTGTDTANKIAARYWKTRYLPEATRQKTAGWTNKSGYGTDVLSGEAGGKDIERIRYYAGKWSYLPVDGTEWIDFNTSASNMVTQKESGAQIAAYYLLKTEVTKEVTTYITDWPDPHDTGSTAIYGVALDYCVKYPGDNVTRYPETFGNSNNNTHWFNCDGTINGLADQNGYTVDANVANAAGWTGRRTNATTSQKNSYDDCYRVINNIEAIDTAEYEVYMITTTPSDSFNLKGYTQCPDMITYPTTREEVIWAIDDQAVTDSGLAKHAELVVGGTPRVNRVMIQQCSGLLLTYYVRAKSNVENLHVNYIDQDTGLLIHSYDIIPHETRTPNNFAGFQWDNANLNAGFATGTDYVYNNEGKKVTVQTDLTKVSGIAGKYQVGFALVGINTADGNKTLNLYYKLDNSRTYVVDFGVPAKVERWGVNDFTKISVEETTLYENRATTKKEVSRTNGKLYVDSYGELYYQLTTMQYKNPDTFNVTYTYQDTGTSTGTTDNSNTYTVTFIPASNVYYEDDNAFMTFTPGAGTAKDAVWNEEFDDSSNQTPAESKQIAEVLNAATNVYGTDPTYENSTKFSLGRAHKVTVSADMVTDWNDNTCRWPTAEFTFKGTGFDVISLTNDKSGLLTYKIEKQDGNGNWTTEKQQFVINYYDYGYDAEKGWTKDTRDTLYQLPVIKADGLAYGTYRVTLTVAYGAIFDKTGENKYSIWLDGVRIYDPAGPTLNETYAKDGEGWPKYIELHDELVKNDKNATTLFIEGDAQADIKAYTSYGPNHEVYLLNEQILAFKLANTAKVDKIHIGAKAPMGHATLKVNGQVIEPAIRTATDMYYDITELVKDDGTVIITNADTAGDSILSLTQLKVTYTAEPTETELASLAILTETEKQQVVQMVRAMYAPVEPEVFTPERFEASWNRSTVKVGQKATLTVKTSEDVEAITVDGVTVTNYRTRTQRTGWGWNAKRVTYREFTYTITAKEAGTLNCSIAAFNAENTASEPITAALTVQAAARRPSWGGWLGNLFGRWF